MKKILFIFLLTFQIFAQVKEAPVLSVEYIMRDPKWIGVSPSNPFWSEDGSTLYFNWNPENFAGDSLYKISVNNKSPQKVEFEERKYLPSRFGSYNQEKSLKLFERNGDILLFNIKNGTTKQLTNTNEYESNPTFTKNGNSFTFLKNNNLFKWNLETNELIQLTDFIKEKQTSKEKSNQEKFLQQEELSLIQYTKEKFEKQETDKEKSEREKPTRPKQIITGQKNVQSIQLSPDENYITFRLVTSKDGNRTIVPNYVTETGYTENIEARSKVGGFNNKYEFGVYDLIKDTVYYLSTDNLPGIKDLADYEIENGKTEKEKRDVIFHGPYYSENGENSVLIIRALDNKDRWIVKLNIKNGTIETLNRERDEAWIAGPGIGSYPQNSGSIGWLPDNETIWFQSEESGYSHIYLLNINSKKKTPFTKGNFEVFDVSLSKDKKSFYFTSSEVHFGERHFYKMNIDGSNKTKLTSLTGNNQVLLSPDEKYFSILYSYSNKPWELFLSENKTDNLPEQITFSSSEEFNNYPWRDPQIVSFTARDGANVPARLYTPVNPIPGRPAVIFVHGAGYLQNVHKWWSSYFREYMFHNLLADNGYYVLDIDFRASSGYGRDWRTAIYRHMGGKDLSDQIDGAKFLIENYGVDKNKIGIYGGSYGGFITLMAMFTEPDVFKAGAALRSVTDWAHYNHGYTSNILNIPQEDSIAYRRSSPIYFAEGLKNHLLICHGMVDDNVHFQDVVRLAQRLIELGKENWEFAVYPVENHGFTEPSSWTDEYKRIFKLFETHLK